MRGSLVVVIVGLGVAVAVGCGSSGPGDLSGELAHVIKTNGQSQLQANVRQYGVAGATVLVNDAQCVESGSSQNYSCRAHYTVSVPASGQSQKFVVNITGTCDSQRKCLWHATGNGVPVAQ